MTIEIAPPEYPRVNYKRRAMAWIADFVVVWLISSILGGFSQFLQIIVFIIAWLISRAIVPYNNRGQSLGRWAFDMTVLDLRRERIPDLQVLFKREAITCLTALLTSIALGNIFRNVAAILLVIPLAIDSGTATTDTVMRQTLHDRYANTIMVSSQRGYSLDIKINRIVGIVRRNVRK